MSSTGTEQVIISAKANVMVYDDVSKKWNPSGSSPGLSKVYIYQSLLNQTYRVVGRKVQDHECVINCMLSKSIKYQANQTFLQWRDVKQVYGLHFGSKDEADHFTQILKTAVENLTRVAQNNLNMNGDNISLGKRSISSEYTNPLITDEYERQQQFNNMNGHNNGTNIYTGINTQRSQQHQQHQQMQNNNHNQVTSPPLSNSSSSSSSTISSNGLLNTINGQQNGNNSNGMNHQQNGNNNNYNGNSYNLNSYPNNQIYNLQQQNNTNGHNINTSSTSSSSSSSSTSSVVQQPLYQSSPIPPPPPPPPPGNLLGLLNGSANNNTISNNSNSSHANDNCSQKIYDIIPDHASYTPNHNSNSNSAPPPPPLPAGLFSSAPANGAPPPPPPIASMQSLSLNNNSQQQSASTNSNSMASELARSIANRQQLKKVEDQPAPVRQAAPPQLDFLTEIRQKLEAKNRSETANGIPSNDNDNLKPSNGLKKINRNAVSSDSPKPIKKITSTPNVLQTNGTTNGSSGHLANGHTNGHANGHMDGQSYDKLKQELMSEFRKELQMIKQDIVNSILNELRR